jgi:hypothetical protein
LSPGRGKKLFPSPCSTQAKAHKSSILTGTGWKGCEAQQCRAISAALPHPSLEYRSTFTFRQDTCNNDFQNAVHSSQFDFWMVSMKLQHVPSRTTRLTKSRHSGNSSLQWTLKKTSMVWVRERTIPTERPPLVGEVITNFCG